MIPSLDSSLPLGMIIGANCPKVLEPQEVIPSANSGPYASRSLLGWRIIGPIGGYSESVKCFKVGLKIPSFDTATKKASEHHFALAPPIKDNFITQNLNAMYQHDFPEENSEKRALSNEDAQFMQMMQDSVVKVDGHYQLPLPFRNSNALLPSNKRQALQRLTSVKKKMSRDTEYKQEYCHFMTKLIDKGYATESCQSPDGKTWFVPHHAVRHPSTKKFRVVFDCSARFNNFCLNEELLQGPDLTNLLVGVLLRFRLGKIAYMADIEAMFYQVQVPLEQQSFLKFLWWPNGNTNKPPREYQMCVHLFGAISSPSCANFALRQTVSDSDCFKTEEGDTVLHNFYVDDMLKSSDDVQSAIETVKKVQDSNLAVST